MNILVCTVGGSDAPVVTAVRAGAWDHVLFVCTSDSLAMVTDRIIDRARGGAPAAERPSIPAQTELDPSLWSTLTVPADDPDAVYAGLIRKLDTLRARHKGATITVNFTGGTKSMSAGAVLAVASRPGTALQVTTGQRSDLVRVVDGTQQAVALGTDRIVLDRQVELLRAIWAKYGYEEAAKGFAALAPLAKDIPDLAARLELWANLGQRLAAWDRFDRKQAASNIRHVRHKLPPDWQRYADLAEQLREDTKARSASALLLLDLLRNAERCAARGRYDDAVARCYRLWEWTAQWLLWEDSKIDTSNVDPTVAPVGFFAEHETNKRPVDIGSAKAWSLYRELHPTRQATLFWDRMDSIGSTPRTHLEIYRYLGHMRNDSILAHGVRPIGATDSERILRWTAGPFIEMVRAEALRLNEPADVPQLPTELPEPVVL